MKTPLVALGNEMKDSFSVKLQTQNRCFFFFFKLKKTQTAQIRNTMQYSSTLIKTSELILDMKKSVLINNWEINFAYWKKPEQNETMLGLFQLQLRFWIFSLI